MKGSFLFSFTIVGAVLPLLPSYPALAQQMEETSAIEESPFSYLESLLSSKKWYEADQETISLIRNNPDNLSCENLQTLDQLWTEASEGKYGLTSQLRIWQNVGGTKCKTCEGEIKEFSQQVGWNLGDPINPIPGRFAGQYPTIASLGWQRYVDSGISIGLFSSENKTWQSWRLIDGGFNIFEIWKSCQS